MKNSAKLFLSLALVAAVCGGVAFPAQGQGVAPQPGDLVRVTVTAVGRGGAAPPAVPAENLLVYQEKQRRPVVGWTPVEVQAAGLDLAILVDDSLDTSVGLQLDDLAHFVRSLPASTRVAVAYANNGSANLRQDFTADHEQAANALRLPLGSPTAFSSVYLSLVDLLQRWPDSGHRRAVLLVSHGIDLFRGVAESSPGTNFDLDRAIREAQRRGVVVYTLYATGAGRIHRFFFLVSNGQGCLSRLALETGGEAFFQGFGTPIAFAPFLEDLGKMLGQQYVLLFRAQLGKKAGYQRLRVTTEQPGVELMAPRRVWVPAAQ